MVAALGSSLGCAGLPWGNSAANNRPPADRLGPQGELARNRGNGNGVLAGQVIDLYNQRRAGASLTVQPVDGGEVVNAVTNDQGYFTINGLQAGKKYKVVGRAKSGELQTVGAVEVTPPNVVVMIKLADSKQEADGKPTGFSGSVGGVHSSIAGPDENTTPRPTGRGDRLGPVTEVNTPTQPRSAVNPRLGRPVTEPSTTPAGLEVRPEYVTQADPRRDLEPRPPTPDLLSIGGPTSPGRTESGIPGRAVSPLLQFPLADLDRRPTSLAAYSGRLTLVDVWNTGCIPCIQAMPELMRLQRTYSNRGLVVVGIAAREAGTPETVAATIRWRGKSVDYPLLMEQEGKSVTATFNVQAFPTLILLDDQGREVWRGVGFSAATKRQLEAELQKRLP